MSLFEVFKNAECILICIYLTCIDRPRAIEQPNTCLIACIANCAYSGSGSMVRWNIYIIGMCVNEAINDGVGPPGRNPRIIYREVVRST